MSKRKLLLADDSITIQKVVNLTFADEEVEVITVGDGDRAMEKIRADAPDLILADVNMPGLSGYQICETIKQSDETKHIPVVLLVGSFEPFDEAEAKRVGADDFLTKPFQSIRLLVSKVSDLLDGKAAETVEAETINSFDDTLEMAKPPQEPVETENLGDAAMDDEMIQTNQIGSLPNDEAQKFESQPAFEAAVEDIDFGTLKQPYEYASLTDYEAENDLGKTQPLSAQDLEEISVDASETKNESADEENLAESNALSKDDIHAPSESAPAAPFDESNPLELPERRNLSAAGRAARNNFGGQTESKQSAGQSVENLSPAAIDAIASRVAELVLDRVVERVAARMAEEK